MPELRPPTRVCRDCDGFATVAVTTGARHCDGTRVTVRVACPTCKGTGTVVRSPRLSTAGVEVAA